MRKIAIVVAIVVAGLVAYSFLSDDGPTSGDEAKFDRRRRLCPDTSEATISSNRFP